jgi:Tfp pilus assembly protein FimT
MDTKHEETSQRPPAKGARRGTTMLETAMVLAITAVVAATAVRRSPRS